MKVKNHQLADNKRKYESLKLIQHISYCHSEVRYRLTVALTQVVNLGNTFEPY